MCRGVDAREEICSDLLRLIQTCESANSTHLLRRICSWFVWTRPESLFMQRVFSWNLNSWNPNEVHHSLVFSCLVFCIEIV